ncbi:unnamed protein product [Amoebophrya sp. A25]|nr:unnamed protein product [Amoebophrya sp. A25]|eukprot:GSA25T00011183001.1
MGVCISKGGTAVAGQPGGSSCTVENTDKAALEKENVVDDLQQIKPAGIGQNNKALDEDDGSGGGDSRVVSGDTTTQILFGTKAGGPGKVEDKTTPVAQHEQAAQSSTSSHTHTSSSRTSGVVQKGAGGSTSRVGSIGNEFPGVRKDFGDTADLQRGKNEIGSAPGRNDKDTDGATTSTNASPDDAPKVEVDLIAKYKKDKADREAAEARRLEQEAFDKSIAELCGSYGNLWYFAHLEGIIPPENILAVVEKLDQALNATTKDANGQPLPEAEFSEFPLPSTPSSTTTTGVAPSPSVYTAEQLAGTAKKDETRGNNSAGFFIACNGKVLQYTPKTEKLAPSLLALLKDNIAGKDITVQAGRNRCHPHYPVPHTVDDMNPKFRAYIEDAVFRGPLGRCFTCVGQLVHESVV